MEKMSEEQFKEAKEAFELIKKEEIFHLLDDLTADIIQKSKKEKEQKQ